MKIKMMPMLLTFLVFAVIALPCGSPLYAQDPGPDIDVTDDKCTDDEIARRLCFEAVGGAYVVQVFVDEWTEDPTLPFNGDLPWPIIDPDAKTKEYRYRASVHENLITCKGVDTWNYFVQKQSAFIADDLIMTVPPGAQLLIPGDSINKCYIKALEDEVLLKLNPSLNCGFGNEVIFSLTYPIDVQGWTRGNQSVVLTKSGCGDPDEPTYILGPSLERELPFHAEQKHTFPDGGSIDVVFDSSSYSGGEDLVKEVYIDDMPVQPVGRAWICTPAPEGSEFGDLYIAKHPVDPDRLILCIEPEQAGLQYQGCVIDANPRTYLFGGDVYTRP
ncbi:MAG: hypothetical protein HF981_09225 [Desulfobacteraceae bacterium]|nr:hypothetical protein [Desulfobacteraceae bacterium]MBC2750552.1 hypothetical protein [Desulfobacteraceae bacterium]